MSIWMLLTLVILHASSQRSLRFLCDRLFVDDNVRARRRRFLSLFLSFLCASNASLISASLLCFCADLFSRNSFRRSSCFWTSSSDAFASNSHVCRPTCAFNVRSFPSASRLPREHTSFHMSLVMSSSLRGRLHWFPTTPFSRRFRRRKKKEDAAKGGGGRRRLRFLRVPFLFVFLGSRFVARCSGEWTRPQRDVTREDKIYLFFDFQQHSFFLGDKTNSFRVSRSKKFFCGSKWAPR